MSTTKDVAYQGFLGSLKPGDKVLVCHEGGEVYEAGEAIPFSHRTAIYVRFAQFPTKNFSRKTGKERGGSLVIQPYDEARHQAHVAQQEARKQRYEEKYQAKQAEKRNAALWAVYDATSISLESLEKLSTGDLQSLAGILGKLKGE